MSLETMHVTRSAVNSAERRQLTVLWCQYQITAGDAESCDPEDLYAMMQRLQQVYDQVSQRFDGYIGQHVYDSLAIYFGYPQAHEDDASRAIYAAFAIRQETTVLFRELQEYQDVEWSVRLGIHTGLAVIGAVSPAASRTQLAIGTPLHIAAQIAQCAAPNTVVISAATLRLAERVVTCQALGTYSFDDPADTLALYAVQQVHARGARVTMPHGYRLTPFVGRVHELRLLHKLWQQSQGGRGQVVLLSGEPGIGKSRLAQAFYEGLHDDGYLLLESRCASSYQHSALYPIIELLQRLLHWHADDTPERKLARLEQALQAYDFPLADTVSLLEPLLALTLPPCYAVSTLPPPQQKQRTFDTLRAWLRQLTIRQPVCLMIEDVHCSDPSTLEFLTCLINQVCTMPLLLLVTCRPDFVPPWPGHSPVTPVTLTRLSLQQTEHMLIQATGGKALPPGAHEYILAKTNGVPLFVEEMLKMVLEAGWVKEQDASYVLVSTLPALAIPATLQASLMARLDQQGPGKEVAQWVATVGHECSYALLTALALLDDATLQHDLAQLVQAGILSQHGVPPQAQYRFRHALIQDAAYQSLLRRTRRHYHRHIAAVLEAQFPETCDTQPEILAHHYTQATCHSQAVPYWRRAGQRALERSAYVEAIQYFSNGLEALHQVTESSARQQDELALHMALGPALMAVQGQTAPEVEHTYARAQALCRQIGNSSQLFPVLMGLWRFYGARAEFGAMQDLTEQLVQIAQDSAEPDLLLEAHMVLGNSLFFRGQFAAARTHCERGIALYQVPQHRLHTVLYGRDPAVVCRSIAGLALWKMGYPEESGRSADAACTLATELAYPMNRAFALCQAALLYQWRREPVQVQALAEEALTLTASYDLGPWLAGQATMQRGWALLMQGHTDAGEAALHNGFMALQRIKALLPWSLTQRLEAYAHLGQAETGLQLLAQTQSIYWQPQADYFTQLVAGDTVLVEVPNVYRLKGELLLALPRPDAEQAEQCFQQALQLARRQGAKADELRTAVQLGRLWYKHGKRDDARELLADLYDWFSKGEQTIDLAEAKAFLQAF